MLVDGVNPHTVFASWLKVVKCNFLDRSANGPYLCFVRAVVQSNHSTVSCYTVHWIGVCMVR